MLLVRRWWLSVHMLGAHALLTLRTEHGTDGPTQQRANRTTSVVLFVQGLSVSRLDGVASLRSQGLSVCRLVARALLTIRI